MRLKNPSFDPKGLDAVKGQILAGLAARPGLDYVTFDQLRGFFTKTVDDWPDVYLAEKLAEWGLSVVAG